MDEHQNFIEKLIWLHEICGGLFQYTFIKSYRHGTSYYDSNIDILINPVNQEDFDAVMAQYGYRPTLNFKEPEKILYKKGHDIGIHLHTMISWNTIEYLDASTVLRNRRKQYFDNNHFVYFESCLDNFLINCAHMIFENYEITLGELQHLQRAIREVDLHEVKKRAGQYGWGGACTYIIEIVEGAENGVDGNFLSHLYDSGVYKFKYSELNRLFKEKIRYERNKKVSWVRLFWVYHVIYMIVKIRPFIPIKKIILNKA